MTAGPNGPVMMQDNILLEKLTQFDREKIPARNVHALGYGVHGHFTVTNDITKYTRADVFSKVGKKTDLFARLSGTFTEQGDPDTTRDIRGFAMKMYTNEGNWDLMTINTPVFVVRDAKPGPDAVHSLKRDPRTSMWYPTQTWDYAINHPEGLHQTLMLYSDRCGTPLSFRYMNTFGCNTFSMVNAQNERFWVKFHVISELGWKGMKQAQAKLLAGEDPNWLGRDLHEAVKRGAYPRYKLAIQVMPEAEGYTHSFTFDCTKAWSHDDFPLIDVGMIELNRNPVDYFSEVEQVAFSPANIVPGIGFSPDKLLQGRLLIYDDTQHHRVGPNHKQLPINCPRNVVPKSMHTGGTGYLDVQNHFPHYWPSSFGGLQPDPKYLEPSYRVDGPAGYYDYPNEGTDEDYYGQARMYWSTLDANEKDGLCDNISTSLFKVESEQIVTGVISVLGKVSGDLQKGVEKYLSDRRSGNRVLTEGEKVWMQMSSMLMTDKVSDPISK